MREGDSLGQPDRPLVSPETGLKFIRLRVAEGNSRAKRFAMHLRFGSLLRAFTLHSEFGNAGTMPTNIHPTLPIPPRSRASRTLIAWMLGAAVLHVVLLAQWRSAEFKPQPFVVSLEQVDLASGASHRNASSAQNLTRSRATSLSKLIAPPTRSAPKNHDPTPTPLITDAQVAGNADIPIASPAQIMPATNQVQPTETISGPELAQTRPDPSTVQDAVWSRFEQTKIYPPMARRYGWEGDLLLGYRVEETGMINNVHVMRSSGNAVLDQSAVRTLNNVGRIPASIWRGGTILDLQLPVIYKLTQG